MKTGLLLSQNARRLPEKAAIIYGEEVLTFRDLDRRSNRMATPFWRKG